MPICCDPRDYDSFFGSKEADKQAASYRKQGLTGPGKRIVEFLVAQGVEGCDVLEVGGGAGAAQVELLRAGVRRTVGVELSGSYEEAASTLLREAGFEDRTERRVGDFVSLAPSLDRADIVMMVQVVCCYPDMETLVGAAAERSRRYLATSFPRDRWWLRLGLRLGNAWFRLTRTSFRAYVHPPARVLEIAGQHGFRPVFDHEGRVLRTLVLERAS